MKKVFMLICALFVISIVYSQQASKTEVLAKAASTLNRLGRDVNVSDIDSVYKIHSNTDDPLIFEVVFRTGEFVVMSAHKACKPVLCYSLKHNSHPMSSIVEKYEELPLGLKDILDNYMILIEYCYNTNSHFPINDEWSSAEEHSDIRNSDIIVVEPLITTKWGQDTSNCGLDPQAYNHYVTNSSNDCSHCFAGCGPVAMAQIMNFWKHPVISSFTNDNFDWCNMTDCLTTTSINYEKERDAVSKLIRKCGQVSHAQYCTNGCATTSIEPYLLYALRDFGYQNCELRYKCDYSTQEWIDSLKHDLDNNLPVLYFGIGTGGHAFVCDGYTRNEYFHFNWGWNGNYNDLWLTLDNISPMEFNFSFNQRAIFNIKPSSHQDFCNFRYPLDTYYSLYEITYGISNMLYSITPSTMAYLESAPSSSPASYRTIPAGATAEYVAHKEVILQPGFTAEYGSDFTAKIEPCAACEERMVQVDVLTDNDDWQGIDTSQMEMRMYRKGDTSIIFQPSALTLFPNPTSNTLTVQAPNPTEDIQIFDIAGHRVYRWYIESRTEKSTILNIADIPTGNYILRVQTKDGKSHIGRFSKK